MSINASFKPCLLIPVYNHGTLIEATLSSLKKYQVPCLLVDDGSDAETAHILDLIATNEATWITLVRLSKNSGKGAAVMHGIAEAKKLGYSHALQIDADGQHNAEDVPTLLAMAEGEPDALISGAPKYDNSVPRSRLYGRYITHFWVWIETLSFDIRDSMCGFRVYPVNITYQLAQTHSIGLRMNFDTDIMVKLYWAGTPVRFLDTQVRYPENGVSHFDMLHDNLRITCMHTKLVAGMLLRLPKLLIQKWQRHFNKQSDQHWSKQKETGSYFGMLVSAWCFRLLGRRALYLMLYPIIAWNFLINRHARIESRRYLQRVLGRPVTHRDVYNHLMAFGRYIVDRLATWNGDIQHSDISFENQATLLNHAASGHGAVIFTSHLGGVEICRALIHNLQGIHLNILAYSQNARKINTVLEAKSFTTDQKPQQKRSGFEMIEITEIGPDTAMLLHDKIQQGEFVVMTADRTSPTSPHRVTTAPFLGEPAAFSQGPFILASLLECPVYLLFVLPTPDNNTKYTVYLEHFSDRLVLPRKQREALLNEAVTRYASRLEHYCHLAPYQWFNFFNFWQVQKS